MVQNALNDLPNLSPNLVKVNQSLANDGISIIYSVEFSPVLGDVNMIEEILHNVNATISETIKGSPDGSAFQLKIKDKTSGLFKFNDTAANVN